MVSSPLLFGGQPIRLLHVEANGYLKPNAIRI